MKNTKLRISERDYALLKSHLFPGDGLEAVAVALCGTSKLSIDEVEHTVVTVNKVHLIEHEICNRGQEYVSWNTESIIPLLQEASSKSGMTLLKIHSHPSGYPRFSETDDKSDKDFFPGVAGWLETDFPGISAVMLNDGKIFGRAFDQHGNHFPISSVLIAGSDILFWPTLVSQGQAQAYMERTEQLFGAETTKRLSQLSVAIVGVSGTGSPVAEMLYRLGVGELILIDNDKLEERNLNRIYNSTLHDVKEHKYKVHVISEELNRIGLPTKVVPINESLFNPNVVRRVAQCDVVFGCMDAADGRQLLNTLSTFYCLPYFDLGVRLEADGVGGINSVDASVHYLKPGGSTLDQRKAITSSQIETDALRRRNSKEYEKRLKEGYIKGASSVGSPAVISVNTMIAAAGINDFLARIHPFRIDQNEEISTLRISFHQSRMFPEPEGSPNEYFVKFIGIGDVRPLLYVPELTEGENP